MKKTMQLCLALIIGITLAVAPVLASQNTVVIPPGPITGISFHTYANNALNTLITQNSGPGEPSTKYAYMLWADTTAAKLKIRNSTNDGWVIIGDLALDRLGLAQVSSLQYASYISGASTTGNDTYVITLSPAPATLVNGMQVILVPDVANTGAASLNVNALGAKSIKKKSGAALVDLADNDIPANMPVPLVYSSTNTAWIHLNTPPPSVVQAFPVGALYLSIDPTNPATTLGYGTWVAWGTGRMAVAVDTGQAEFNTVEKTGGGKTKNLSHTHYWELPYFSSGTSGVLVDGNSVPITSNVQSGYRYWDNTGSGGSATQDVLNPYITCYFWKRTG